MPADLRNAQVVTNMNDLRIPPQLVEAAADVAAQEPPPPQESSASAARLDQTLLPQESERLAKEQESRKENAAEATLRGLSAIPQMIHGQAAHAREAVSASAAAKQQQEQQPQPQQQDVHQENAAEATLRGLSAIPHMIHGQAAHAREVVSKKHQEEQQQEKKEPPK